jgi:hypothetical protein
MKLEAVLIPVSDMDRAKHFCQSLGCQMDAAPPSIVQFTPPGSGWSVQFGGNHTTAAPSSAQGLWLIVSNLLAALDKMATPGIAVNEVYHIAVNGKSQSLHPERLSYRSFAWFQDLDGNH